MSEWRPISHEELQSLIAEGLLQAGVEERRIFDLVRKAPEKWALPPWGDQGGGFWVVGILGEYAIWYNDIEEGFNVSEFSEWRQLGEYACDKLELHHWLYRLRASIVEGKGFPGMRSGAPKAVV